MELYLMVQGCILNAHGMQVNFLPSMRSYCAAHLHEILQTSTPEGIWSYEEALVKHETYFSSEKKIRRKIVWGYLIAGALLVTTGAISNLSLPLFLAISLICTLVAASLGICYYKRKAAPLQLPFGKQAVVRAKEYLQNGPRAQFERIRGGFIHGFSRSRGFQWKLAQLEKIKLAAETVFHKIKSEDPQKAERIVLALFTEKPSDPSLKEYLAKIMLTVNPSD